MKIILKNLFIIICAAIASIGTYPYAKNFASNIFISSEVILFATATFVIAALTANIALGTFSIIDTLKVCRNTKFIRCLATGIIAVIASVATGFLCVVGYYETLPLRLNIFISLTVAGVNAAISFSAVHNACNHFFSRTSTHHENIPFKKFLILLTMSGALIASSVFYLATVNGLLSIFNYQHFFAGYQKLVAFTLSMLVWFPGAALFINSSRVTISELYDKCSRKDFSFSWQGFIIAMIALFSGSAFAQMSIEFFDTSKQIPDFFRVLASHDRLVICLIMPITFSISSLVNAYALNNIYIILKVNRP